MNLNKCNRCGNFFMTEGNVCPTCSQKDNIDKAKLENYFQQFNNPQNLNEISANTGISISNLNRHLQENPDISSLFGTIGDTTQL